MPWRSARSARSRSPVVPSPPATVTSRRANSASDGRPVLGKHRFLEGERASPGPAHHLDGFAPYSRISVTPSARKSSQQRTGRRSAAARRRLQQQAGPRGRGDCRSSRAILEVVDHLHGGRRVVHRGRQGRSRRRPGSGSRRRDPARSSARRRAATIRLSRSSVVAAAGPPVDLDQRSAGRDEVADACRTITRRPLLSAARHTPETSIAWIDPGALRGHHQRRLVSIQVGDPEDAHAPRASRATARSPGAGSGRPLARPDGRSRCTRPIEEDQEHDQAQHQEEPRDRGPEVRHDCLDMAEQRERERSAPTSSARAPSAGGRGTRAACTAPSRCRSRSALPAP